MRDCGGWVGHFVCAFGGVFVFFASSLRLEVQIECIGCVALRVKLI